MALNIFSLDFGHRHPKMDSRRRRQLIISYAPDWVVTIGLSVLFLALGTLPGFKREFSLDDKTIYYPFAEHERVPPVALFMICLVSPLILQAIINALTVCSWWDLHTSYLGLILSLGITGTITQFIKLTAGRPRPDLIARCMPMTAADPPLGLSTVSICTQTDSHIIDDGWRSFPSGHSSLSFAGLGFLAFYLAGKLHLFDNKGYAIKAWITLVPLSAAALVAVSRTMDNRHHWEDVLAAAILGMVVAWFAYRQYYPSLSSELSHRPYSPRIKRDEQLLPTLSHHLVGAEQLMPEDDDQTRYRDRDFSDDVELPYQTLLREHGPSNNQWKDHTGSQVAGAPYSQG
ncbi:acid phosphatase/Vanadium-dependent haloperoxidase [Obba rivulosa]|uniref:Acid phosphatase/Vanadium-dependent haloperoxidase n=1 Tax=Obba rivulosa TaxID=1052685 RepID=A0A8E2J541_9APHY|nr:acid phosphatase/Vanadium-dependent haloperoxidase [Obba rivulosa]